MPPNIRPSFPPNNAQSKLLHQQSPNVFSAPPSIISKPPQTSIPSNQPPPPPSAPSKPSMTFEAKPQIRYFHFVYFSIPNHSFDCYSRARQDVTKFVPTVLKVRRDGTAGSGAKSTDKSGGMQAMSRFEDPLSMRGRMGNPSGMPHAHLMMTGPSTDDAYDTFMKEINQLI